jgi:hypothetical protein
MDALTARFKDLPNVVDKATASALNKLGAKGQTEASKGIRETYNIKAADVKKAVTRVPAKASYGGKQKRMFTILYIKGGRLGLHKFGGLPSVPANQAGVPIKRRKDPTVKILVGGGRRKVAPDVYGGTGNKPFVARMSSGFGGSETNHVGIFVRTDKWLGGNRWRGGKPGTKHQVIRELRSKGIAESFLSHGRDQIDKYIAAEGASTLAHELDTYFKKSQGTL